MGCGKLTVDLSMPRWRKQAECLNLDVDLFFDEYEDDPETAKFVDSVCAACPVKLECLKYATETNASGVHGGMYLMLGEYSRSRNTHKTKKRMREETEILEHIKHND